MTINAPPNKKSCDTTSDSFKIYFKSENYKYYPPIEIPRSTEIKQSFLYPIDALINEVFIGEMNITEFVEIKKGDIQLKNEHGE